MGYLLTIVSFLSMLNPAAHDIHVSISEIEVREDHLELVLKTFIDDLQIAVGLEAGAELPSDYTSSDDLIAQYLKESITLSINNSVLVAEIDDISASPDAVWITVLYDTAPVTHVNHIDIQSTFLTEVYDDQTNLIKIETTKGLTTKLLNKGETDLTIEL